MAAPTALAKQIRAASLDHADPGFSSTRRGMTSCASCGFTPEIVYHVSIWDTSPHKGLIHYINTLMASIGIISVLCWLQHKSVGVQAFRFLGWSVLARRSSRSQQRLWEAPTAANEA